MDRSLQPRAKLHHIPHLILQNQRKETEEIDSGKSSKLLLWFPLSSEPPNKSVFYLHIILSALKFKLCLKCTLIKASYMHFTSKENDTLRLKASANLAFH